MSANVQIRAIGEDERDAWDPLWAGYLTFYKSTLAQEISDIPGSGFTISMNRCSRLAATSTADC